jgi:hypothetical protein
VFNVSIYRFWWSTGPVGDRHVPTQKHAASPAFGGAGSAMLRRNFYPRLPVAIVAAAQRTV